MIPSTMPSMSPDSTARDTLFSKVHEGIESLKTQLVSEQNAILIETGYRPMRVLADFGPSTSGIGLGEYVNLLI